jgi:hypothetical protein
LQEQPTLHLCLGAQQSTRTPAATDCDDCVRLFVGAASGACLEVRSFKTQCKTTQLISNTKCCRSHFTGKFWIVRSIVLILPRPSSFGSLKCHLGVSDYTIMRGWMWLFVKVFECKNPVSTVMEFLNSCQDGTYT